MNKKSKIKNFNLSWILLGACVKNIFEHLEMYQKTFQLIFNPLNQLSFKYINIYMS